MHPTAAIQNFKFEYADPDDIPMELFCRGMISLTLTIVNIVCILIVGVIMLLIKQVQDETHLQSKPYLIYLANIYPR